MLSQYLISNQSLQLNNTFKLYLKILSIDHQKFKNQYNAKKIQKGHHYFIKIRINIMVHDLKQQKSLTIFGH